jgi:hypothetical protein
MLTESARRMYIDALNHVSWFGFFGGLHAHAVNLFGSSRVIEMIDQDLYERRREHNALRIRAVAGIRGQSHRAINTGKEAAAAINRWLHKED